MSVDGTDFPISEPYPFSKRWLSHKINRAGIRYEIALSIRTSDIVWVNGGLPAGDWPDIKIARAGLVHVLEHGEHVIADEGYKGLGFVLYAPKDDFSKKSLLIRRILARHEGVNARIRKFKVMRDRYDGDLSFHPTIFHAVINICQLEIDNGEELPDVRFK